MIYGIGEDHFSCCARFGLLKKAAKKEDAHKERKESHTEQQAKDHPRRESTPGREFSPQQKVKCPVHRARMSMPVLLRSPAVCGRQWSSRACTSGGDLICCWP